MLRTMESEEEVVVMRGSPDSIGTRFDYAYHCPPSKKYGEVFIGYNFPFE